MQKEKDPDIINGDIVLIKEDDVKRRNWKLGRVERLIQGRDGVIRGAELKTAEDGYIGRISRPLQKLYPLEVSERKVPLNVEEGIIKDMAEEDVSGEKESRNEKGKSVPGNIPVKKSQIDVQNDTKARRKCNTRPSRAAAIDGEVRRRFTSKD